MANLTYRQSIQEAPSSTTTKNASLTSQEIDGNFKSLNDELITKAPLVSPGFSGVPTAPTATAGTNTTQLATTAFVIGQAGTASPSMDGVSAVGTSTKFAREDHVHPTNATSTNTGSTIVQRDASGNFSAGTITAALSGNAASATTATTATQLATAHTINGTNFDGSANITTSSWGTSRTITVGNTGKAVSGSANVSWSLAEIGADDASNLVKGTVPDARLSGTYSGFTHKIDGPNTVFTTPSTGTTSPLGRTVYGLAEYKSNDSNQVGAIVFIAPNTASSIMHLIEVSALLHNQSIVVQQVQGHRDTGSWGSTRKVSTGSADIQTRWGVTPDGRNCLILGDVATVWVYPHISITKAMFSYNGVTDSYCTGWTVAVVTDLSAYTNVTATITDSPMTGSVTGNASTATTLQTGRAINGVTFNGSAPIDIQWKAVAIPVGADLDTYQSEGVYFVAANTTAATLVNSPTTNAFTMRVWKAAGVVQEITEYKAATVRKTYQRAFYSTWSTWDRIYTTIDIPTKTDVGLGNVANVLQAAQALTLTAGNGLTGGGDLSADRTFTLGTPSTLTTATANAVTATSHTHAVTFPVTSVASKTGAVSLSSSDVGLGNVSNDAQLKIASNLLDLNNVATARTNLGIANHEKITVNSAGEAVISTSGGGTALRVTQSGTGNALVVEDSASTDSSPLVVDSGGNLIVGATTSEGSKFRVVGSSSFEGGVSANLPSDFWTGAGIAVAPSFEGGVLGTNGGYRTSWLCNGYRNTSNQWTSVNLNGNTGAAAIEMDPTGEILFYTDTTKLSGSSMLPSQRMKIDGAGRVGIGDSSLLSSRLRIGGITSASSGYSLTLQNSATFDPSVATTGAYQYHSSPSVLTGTLPDLRHYNAQQSTFTGSVTLQKGFEAANTLTGATKNYGFYGNIPNGTGRWNFYANGTAPNYFAGNVGLGTASPAVTLDINATDAIRVPLGTTAQRPTGVTGYLRFNTELKKFEGYNGTVWGAIGASVSVKDFGAVGNGVADDTTAIQAALTYAVANSPCKLIFPSGKYKCNSVLGSFTGSDVEIDLQGSTLDFSALALSSTGPLLQFSGSYSTGVALTASATEGAKTIFAPSAGFAVGDMVRVYSNAVWDSTRTSTRVGEINFVVAIPNSSSLTLSMELKTAYTTGDLAKVQKITPVKRITLRNGVIVGPTGNDQLIGVMIEAGNTCLVENLKSYDIDKTHLRLVDCVYSKVTGCHFEESNHSSQAYGVSFQDATQDCVAIGNTFTNVRHSLSTNNAVATSWGIVRRILFASNAVTDSSPATGGAGGDAIDTHAGAEEISILGNTVNSSSGYGINFEARSGVIANNLVKNTATGGIYVHPRADTPSNISVVGNTLNAIGDSVSEYGIHVAALTADCIGCVVSNNHIESFAQPLRASVSGAYRFKQLVASSNTAWLRAGATTINGVEITSADFAAITGNTVKSGAAGIVLTDCKNSTVQGNTVEIINSSGSSGWGIRVQGTSTRIAISGNALRYSSSGITSTIGISFAPDTVTYSGVWNNVAEGFATVVGLSSGTGNAAANNL